MSKFSETAAAAEPVLDMLVAGGCTLASVTIFDDGSGSFTVHRLDENKAQCLLKAHGVDLDGRISLHDKDDYHFGIDHRALKKYVEKPCPHCGKDTEVAL